MGKLNDEGKMMNEANITVKANRCSKNKIFFKVDVDLFGLPNIPYGGHEVVVEFANKKLNNNGTFYTDSNGLDM